MAKTPTRDGNELRQIDNPKSPTIPHHSTPNKEGDFIRDLKLK